MAEPRLDRIDLEEGDLYVVDNNNRSSRTDVSVIQLRDQPPVRSGRSLTGMKAIIVHSVLAVLLIADAIAASIFGDPLYLSLLCFIEAFLIIICALIEIIRRYGRLAPACQRHWDCVRTSYKFFAIYASLGLVGTLVFGLEIGKLHHSHEADYVNGPTEFGVHVITCAIAMLIAVVGIVAVLVKGACPKPPQNSYGKLHESREREMVNMGPNVETTY